MDIPTLTAGFAGWEPFIDLDDVTAVPFPFIQEHGHEHSPSIITIGLSKIECLFQSRHIQTDVLHICRRFLVDRLCFWVLKGDGTVPLLELALAKLPVLG